MTIKGKQVCPVCGMLFPESSEACPVCELRGALDPESDPPSVKEAPSASLLRFEHYRVLHRPTDHFPTGCGLAILPHPMPVLRTS